MNVAVDRPLARVVLAGRAAASRAEARPLDWIPFLPLQERYLRSRSKFRCLRAGNQALGKTTAALADLAWHALGTHPHRACPTPGEYWVICASWSQSVAIQCKLYELLPKEALAPDTIFTNSRGFRGKNPAVEVKHRAGGFSIIRFRTTQQGTLNLAGATIHGALFDEPPSSEEVYAEVTKRVLATDGWVSIALTPIGAPTDWLKQAVEEGKLEDIHSELTVEALTPRGWAHPRRLGGVLCDDAWIAEVTRQTPTHEVPVRVHGEWEVRVLGRWFDRFRSSGEGAHVHTRQPTGDVRLALGIDHGSSPGKQIALLLAIEDRGEHPRIYVVDEYCDRDGSATPEDDAAGILAMLTRHGARWKDLDCAGGDIVHMRGTGRQKSNKDLAVQLGRKLGIPADALHPQIRTVKQGRANVRGAVKAASRWLYQVMLRDGHFGVHPRCKRLIEALDRYHPDRDDENKDPVDALRYGLDKWIWRGARVGVSTPIRIY